jgi:hypothetical protein
MLEAGAGPEARAGSNLTTQVVGPIRPTRCEVVPSPTSTSPGAEVVSPDPAQPAGPGSDASTGPYAYVEAEHHVRVTVDESACRTLAAAHGFIALSVVLATAPEGDGATSSGGAPDGKPGTAPGGAKRPAAKGKAGQDSAPPTPLRSYAALLMLDCSGLLVGDTSARAEWPDKAKGTPVGLAAVAEGVEVGEPPWGVCGRAGPVQGRVGVGAAARFHPCRAEIWVTQTPLHRCAAQVEVRLLSLPPPPPPPSPGPKGAKAPPAKPSSAIKKPKGKEDAPPEPELRSVLEPQLTSHFPM